MTAVPDEGKKSGPHPEAASLDSAERKIDKLPLFLICEDIDALVAAVRIFHVAHLEAVRGDHHGGLTGPGSGRTVQGHAAVPTFGAAAGVPPEKQRVDHQHRSGAKAHINRSLCSSVAGVLTDGNRELAGGKRVPGGGEGLRNLGSVGA